MSEFHWYVEKVRLVLDRTKESTLKYPHGTTVPHKYNTSSSTRYYAKWVNRILDPRPQYCTRLSAWYRPDSQAWCLSSRHRCFGGQLYSCKAQPKQEQYEYFTYSEIERKTGIRGTQISTSITTNIHSKIYKNKFGFQERFGATRRGSILVPFELYGTSILYRTLAHQKVLKHAARSKGKYW